jgi:RHS repeat-associated protein
MTDALNHTTTSTYDGVGNLRFLTDANNHTTEFQYDAANRLVRKIYPDTPSDMLAYTYDGVGNLLTRTDQKSHTTLYRYTDLYFLAQRDYPADADDNFSYDLAGRMLTAEKGGWLDTFAYDGANRLTNTTQNGKMVVSVYANPTGQRFVTYPGGRAIVEQTDFRSRLVAIDDGASPRPIAEQTYDLGNRLVQRANRNGTVAAYGYNANGWITSLEHTHGVTRIAGFAYDYDREGNKNYEAKLHDTADSEAYQYDPAYQLTDYKVGALSGGGIPSPSLEKTYNLDPVGNWNSLTSTLVPGGTTVEVRTHNAANKLTVRNGVPFTYDANGNLTQDELYNYAYDEENRLCAVKRRSDAQVVGQYDYDALSRRVIKIANPAGTPTQTRFYYDDQRIIEEQDTLGVAQATYVYGNYIDEVLTMDHADQTYYCHANALWSVEAVSDSTASPVERYAYDAYGFVTVTDGTSTPVPLNAWGTPHSAIGNPNLFTGRQLDEDTGQYNYRARSYDCFKGRFMQRDPQAELTPDWALIGQDHNLYSYVGNRPTYTGDPSGRAAPIIIAGIIIGGLAIVTVTYCAIVDRNDCVKQCGVGCVKSAHHDHVTVSGISISTLKIASVSIPCGWTCECK